MQLGRQTDVPEVQSYLDERAVRLGGCCSSRAERGKATNVIALIDADVGDHRVLFAIVVGRGAEGISHGHVALEIGNAVGFSVEAIKCRSNTGKKLIEERGWESTLGRYRLSREQDIPARYGYWYYLRWRRPLSPHRNTSEG